MSDTTSGSNNMDIRQSTPTNNLHLLFSGQNTQQTTVSPSSLDKLYLISASNSPKQPRPNEQGFIIDQHNPHGLSSLSPLLLPGTPQHARDDTSYGGSTREAPQSSSNDFTYVDYITHTLTEEDRIALGLKGVDGVAQVSDTSGAVNGDFGWRIR